jgi:hypothetical protein
MFPEDFPRLSFEDNVLVARINLYGATIALLVFAFLGDEWPWPIRSLLIALSAGCVYLAQQVEPLIRRLQAGDEPEARTRALEFDLLLR